MKRRAAVEESKGREQADENEEEDEEEEVLSPEQRRVLDAILGGKSIFFTGPAGTGKSLILKRLSEELEKRNRLATTYFTATTGIAALNIGGTTLHKFVGFGLLKESAEKLVEKIQRGGMSSFTRSRWLQTRLLVIDEISMLSGPTLDKIDAIAKEVRRNDRPFGGIQVVFCGDFFQLPPVAKGNMRGEYVFDSKSWEDTVEEIIVLKTVFRQKSDPLFVDLLNKIRKGEVPENMAEILEQTRAGTGADDDDGIVPTKLFARNDDVNAMNDQQLSALPGEEVVYKSVDQFFGKNATKRDVPDGVTIPETLKLKVGAQVMLTFNINVAVGLCNGTRGVVQRFRSGFPVVKFDNGMELLVNQLPMDFEERGHLVFRRVQLPLRLAWAITIHKSQGMTISRLEVECNGIHQDGQFYVAISRARSLKGLRLKNFKPEIIRADLNVLDFYAMLEEQEEHQSKRQRA